MKMLILHRNAKSNGIHTTHFEKSKENMKGACNMKCACPCLPWLSLGLQIAALWQSLLVCHCLPWLALASPCQPWLALASPGWPWLALATPGWPWLANACCPDCHVLFRFCFCLHILASLQIFALPPSNNRNWAWGACPPSPGGFGGLAPQGSAPAADFF